MMSPGKHTKIHLARKKKRLERMRLLLKQSKYKRRRLELKAERCSKDAAQSVLEGTFNFIVISVNQEIKRTCN